MNTWLNRTWLVLTSQERVLTWSVVCGFGSLCATVCVLFILKLLRSEIQRLGVLFANQHVPKEKCTLFECERLKRGGHGVGLVSVGTQTVEDPVSV